MEKSKWNNFANAVLETYQIEDLNLNQERALKALASEIESEFIDLNKIETKTARFNFFNIPNTNPEDYAEYLVVIPEKGALICGIRHLCSQREEPFVHLLPAFKTTKEELLDLYHHYLSDSFKVFKPKKLRFYTSNKIDADEFGMVHLVQKASVIKSNVQFELEKEIDLIAPQSANYYHWYAENYRFFHEANPEIALKVPVNDQELMEESRVAGLLREASYKGVIVGLIAALPTPFLGNEGVYFIDILLKEEWRGKGVAKAIQRKFIDIIVANDALVWGTIDVANKASFNTARANLRKKVRYENFIAID